MALVALFCVPSLPASGAVQAAPVSPIVIDGDADLCNDEDGDGSVGQDDGIVNCASADGSPERPFVISGLTAAGSALQPAVGCDSDPDREGTRAVLIICQVSRHLRLDGMTLTSDEPVALEPPSGVSPADLQCGPTIGSSRTYGLAVLAAPNLTVAHSSIQHSGPGLYVWSSDDLSMSARPTFSVLTMAAAQPLSPGAQVLPAIVVRNSSLALSGLTLDGGRRCFGIVVSDSFDPPNQTISLRDSVIRGFAKSAVAGVDARFEIARSQFLSDGSPEVHMNPSPANSLAGTGGAILQVANSRLSVDRSRFDVLGAAIYAHSSVVDVHHSFFNAVAEASPGAAYAIANSIGCNVRLAFNDFNGTRVLHAGACTDPIFAQYNWWGTPSGPSNGPTNNGPAQADGRFTTDFPLAAPWERLPVVSVISPPPKASVYGRVDIEGSASATGEPVELVQVGMGPDEFSWSTPQPAEGVSPWAYTLDTTGMPYGAVRLWFRACSATAACGVPTSLELLVVPKPQLPIALLDVSPPVAHVGEAVLLDASNSYSPQGRPILRFRFDLGQGDPMEWGNESRIWATYNKSGSYPLGVAVQDEDGFLSGNSPQIVLRILDVERPKAKVAGVLPGLDALAAVFALGLIVLLRRGRR